MDFALRLWVGTQKMQDPVHGRRRGVVSLHGDGRRHLAPSPAVQLVPRDHQPET